MVTARSQKWKHEHLGKIFLGYSDFVVNRKNITEKSKELVLPESHIGCELEIEELPLSMSFIEDGIPYWYIEEDHSLRGANAWEFKHKEPFYGDKLVKSIYYLTNKIRNAGGGQISERCSLHVHLNMKDFNIEQFKLFLLTYIILERSLYNYCKKDREYNGYCLPIYNTEIEIEPLHELFFHNYTNNYDGLNKLNTNKTFHHSSFNKYSGLNIGSVFVRGSLEFRMHPGTIDKEEFLKWINIILCLKRFSMEYEDIIYNYHDTIKDIGLYNLPSVIFPTKLEKELYYKNIQNDLQKGFILSLELLNFSSIKTSLFDLL